MKEQYDFDHVEMDREYQQSNVIPIMRYWKQLDDLAEDYFEEEGE